MVSWRLGQDLELVDFQCPLPMDGSQAVRAGIAAAQNNHALAFRRELGFVFRPHPGHFAVLLRQELHGKVDAFEVAPRNRQVTRDGGTACQHDGVKLRFEFLRCDVHANVDAGLEDHAFGLHLLQAAIQHPLLHLKVGDAIAQQPADLIVALEDGDGMPGAVQLLRGGQSRRAGPDDSDLLVSAEGGRFRRNPALGPAAHGDGLFDALNGDGVLIDAQHAGGLAGRGAELAGELRKVIGGVEFGQRLLPAVPVDEVVPVRDDVAERAALMTEWDAAVHAARRLLLQFLVGEV